MLCLRRLNQYIAPRYVETYLDHCVLERSMAGRLTKGTAHEPNVFLGVCIGCGDDLVARACGLGPSRAGDSSPSRRPRPEVNENGRASGAGASYSR